MKHLEVKQLYQELNILLRYLVEKKVANYHLNYGLDRNETKLIEAVKAIGKNINAELLEIEQKAVKFAKETTEKGGKECSIVEAIEQIGEKKRHEELMEEYRQFLEEENEFTPYYLNPEKLETMEIEYPYYQILKNFLPNV